MAKILQTGRGFPIGEVLARWAKVRGRNIVIDAGVKGTLAVFAFSPREDGLLTALAAAVGADFSQLDRGIVRIEPSVATKATMTLTSEQVELASVLTHFEPVGPPIELATPGDERVSVFVSGGRVFDALRAAAIAAGHRLIRDGAGYRIE